MTRKILIATAISAALGTASLAFGDEDATRWPDKATPREQATAAPSPVYKDRSTTRADEAMSGTDGAAARGSTRPVYDPPRRPNDARPIPPFRAEPSAAAGGTVKRKGE